MGILSNVALKRGKLVVSCDFVIIDIPEDVKDPKHNREIVFNDF